MNTNVIELDIETAAAFEAALTQRENRGDINALVAEVQQEFKNLEEELVLFFAQERREVSLLFFLLMPFSVVLLTVPYEQRWHDLKSYTRCL